MWLFLLKRGGLAEKKCVVWWKQVVGGGWDHMIDLPLADSKQLSSYRDYWNELHGGGGWVLYSTTDDKPHHAYGIRLNLMVISRIQHMLQCVPLARVYSCKKTVIKYGANGGGRWLYQWNSKTFVSASFFIYFLHVDVISVFSKQTSEASSIPVKTVMWWP